MKKLMNKTKSSKMLTVWCVTYVLTGVVFSIFRIILSVHYGYAPDEVLGIYHLAVTTVISVFFFPMLFPICYFAKKEGSKPIFVVASILLGIVTLWMVLNCISIIRELINY